MKSRARSGTFWMLLSCFALLALSPAKHGTAQSFSDPGFTTEIVATVPP